MQAILQALKYNTTLTHFNFPASNLPVQHPWIEDCFRQNTTLESGWSSEGMILP